jgi:hypothetical protein
MAWKQSDRSRTASRNSLGITVPVLNFPFHIKRHGIDKYPGDQYGD